MAKRFKLINPEIIPKENNRINLKKCVGLTLKYEYNNYIYDIKIIDYIYNKKSKNNKFLIEYIYLEEYPDYKEIIRKEVNCNNFINQGITSNIIPSSNRWKKINDYWVGKDCNNIEFKFNTKNKDLEYKILHSTWYISKYVKTTSLNNNRESWSLHQVIAYKGNKNLKNNNYVPDHINNDVLDNREDNIRLVTKQINSKNVRKDNNKNGMLTGMYECGNGWRSRFETNGKKLNTTTKKDKGEAELDNLIAQKYLGCMHNNDQFYRIEELSEERIKEVTDNLDRQINGIKLDKAGIKNSKAMKLICIFPDGTQTEPMCQKELAKYLELNVMAIRDLFYNKKEYKPRYKKHSHLNGIKIIEVI